MFNHQKLLLKISTPLLLLLLLLHISAAAADCSCDTAAAGEHSHHNRALKLKLGAIAAILVAGAAGVTLPLLAKHVPSLRPDSDAFFVIKAFAAGVILATGFVHILPDAFERLASPCIGSSPWADFPFAGLISMVAAIGALIIDASATGVYRKKHFGKQVVNAADEERGGSRGEHAGHVHVHTHATHGHAHGSADPDGPEIGGLPDLVRHRIISQVLEIGIVVHSVIIGISLGVSGSPKTIKPLLGALSFHQFFEGMGLGGCISQAKFESRPMAIMATCFSLTTPVGVAIGIAIASVYEEQSSTALIVEGALNSASAGILVYMALVDLLAADFMNPRLQSNGRLFSCASVFLFLGTGLMSLLAIWA